MIHHRRAASAAILSALLAVSASSAQTWQFENSSDSSEPTQRHEAAYVEFDGKFYLMGGRGPRPVDEYDPVSDTWTDLGEPPIRMHHFQPVVFDDLVWVICAFEGNYPNETAIQNIYTYDPSTNNWTIGPTIPANRNRGAAACVVYDGAIYVVGGNTQGHNGGYVPWLDRYDPATDTWTPLPDAPHARDHFTAAAIGNKLYCAGGRQTEQPNPFLNTIGPVDVYDFTSATWSNTPFPIPTERAGTMTVARGEHLIVIGGETSSQAHGETEALDVGTGEWLILPWMNQPRHSGGAVLHDDTIYVCAGSGSNGGSPELETQERLALATLLPTSTANLLANGEFDGGLTSWTDAGDLTLEAGDGGIEAPSLDVENGSVTQTVAAATLESYTLRALFKAFGSTGSAEIALEYLNGGGVEIGESVVALANTSDFTSFELRGVTPALTASIRVRATASGDRTLRVDDLVLVETQAEIVRLGNPANPPALLPSTGGPIADTIWDPRIDHSEFTPSASADLLAIGLTPINAVVGLGTALVEPVLPILPSGPGVPFAIPVPDEPFMIGLLIVAQGASIEFGAVSLTNALDVTIQAP